MFYIFLLFVLSVAIKIFKLGGDTLLKICFVLFIFSSLLYLVNLKDFAEVGMRISFLFGLVGILILVYQLRNQKES